MNANLFHNLVNGASLLLAAGQGALMASGCTIDAASQVLNCSASWLPPQYTLYAIAALQVIKFGVNIYRDGLGGLAKQQPPVDKTPSPPTK